MKTIDEYAKEGSRQIGRWYGTLGTFERYIAHERVPTCEEWLKAHWQRFPATSPDGGKTIDHDARVFFPAKLSQRPIPEKTARLLAALDVVERKYSGDLCGFCGGSNMLRTGTCVTCQDCGTNEGCS